MHLQNELLGDLKRVENKIEAKIKKVNQSVEEQKEELEKKMNYLENAYTVLLQRTNNIKTNDNSKEQEILSKIEILNKKIEDHSFRLENKYNSFMLPPELEGEIFNYYSEDDFMNYLANRYPTKLYFYPVTDISINNVICTNAFCNV